MKRGRSRANRLCLLYDPRARRWAVTYSVGRYDRLYRTVFVEERVREKHSLTYHRKIWVVLIP